MRAPLLAAALAVVAVAAPGTGSASARTTGSCSAAAAKKAILATPSLGSLRPYLAKGAGGGVDGLICHDFTRDGVPDMATAVFSGGTAGDIAWVAFRRAGHAWVLAQKQLSLYKVGLFLRGGDLVDSQPVYRRNDPNCCPTGGFDHRRFHWNGRRLALVRRWHDKRFRP
jgi:hypothetical protein